VPPHVQQARARLSLFLLRLLQSPNAGLTKYAVFRTALSRPCGYQAFVELLRLGQHPRLLQSLRVPSLPKQRGNTLRVFLQDWSHYLFCLVLAGETLCDRCVSIALVAGMHRECAAIQTQIQSVLKTLPFNCPLPPEYSIDQLHHTLELVGGHSVLDRVPGDRSQPAVRQLLTAQEEHAILNNYDIDDAEDLVVRALHDRRRSPQGGLCYFCRHPTDIHKRADCPLIKKILQDPNYAELVAGLQASQQRAEMVRVLGHVPMPLPPSNAADAPSYDSDSDLEPTDFL